MGCSKWVAECLMASLRGRGGLRTASIAHSGTSPASAASSGA
eukprot:CAMPEP_0170303674 /NCGR_PEP_ID=MMETSP0116_2-20130129/52163_1 /TAXON_ID=400756 /ORGANISM="Durinskia baltica, Strain CSIRO CS-38" /LENGTH=41 /DNA_ID= /DNA_START= /DNA_END= /DNA_ORIENTATION=